MQKMVAESFKRTLTGY